jgi:hypothetical protein
MLPDLTSEPVDPEARFVSRDYYLDLLFYHLRLRCYVVIELKAVPFDPASIGQANSLFLGVDDLLRHFDDRR